jgi:hypothetical protein
MKILRYKREATIFCPGPGEMRPAYLTKKDIERKSPILGRMGAEGMGRTAE